MFNRDHSNMIDFDWLTMLSLNSMIEMNHSLSFSYTLWAYKLSILFPIPSCKPIWDGCVQQSLSSDQYKHFMTFNWSQELDWYSNGIETF